MSFQTSNFLETLEHKIVVRVNYSFKDGEGKRMLYASPLVWLFLSFLTLFEALFLYLMWDKETIQLFAMMCLFPGSNTQTSCSWLMHSRPGKSSSSYKSCKSDLRLLWSVIFPSQCHSVGQGHISLHHSRKCTSSVSATHANIHI